MHNTSSSPPYGDVQQGSEELHGFGSANPFYSNPFHHPKSFSGTQPYPQQPFQQNFFHPSSYQQYQKHQPVYIPQSAPSFVASSQSSEGGADAASTVGSFQTFATVTSPTPSKFNSFSTIGVFPSSVDYPIPKLQSTEVEKESSVDSQPQDAHNTEDTGIKADKDGLDVMSVSSTSESTPFVKQDPSQLMFQSLSDPLKQTNLMQQMNITASMPQHSSKPVQYHSVNEATQFNKRGHPSSEMGDLALAVTEYSLQMPQKVTLMASKCHADECGFVLVFEVPKISTLAIAYFKTGNLSVCDIIFTNSQSIVNMSPMHFTGHFICMLRRTKTIMPQKLKNVVIDDILCCRPWFETKYIEFNTINPIISNVSIVCGGRKAICIGQTATVNFCLNACNPSPLYFHPEAKGLQFSPQMVIVPAMSCLSLPIKITPLEGCDLRPHIRLILCDLHENEEKIGLSMPFIVLPQIKPLRTIRGHEVIYVNDDKSCLRVLDELNMIACGFVFLDTEWKPMSSNQQHNKIALIQICADKKCYLIHIHKFRDRIPLQLFNFLASPKILKIGLAISNDAKKFQDDYKHPMQPLLDLRDFCWFQDRDRKSLNFLVQNVLKEPNRTKKCTMSNWENDLDDLQVEYAALDVIFMSEIFEQLFGNDSTMQAYAILMFKERKQSLTKNIIPMQPQKPSEPEPTQTEDVQTGTMALVDANGNMQYRISEKHAKRLLMLQQARKISENVLQLQ